MFSGHLKVIALLVCLKVAKSETGGVFKNISNSKELDSELNGAEIKELAGLYDQHRWSDRLDFVDNEKCRKEVEVYVEGLHNASLWAAKMFDASGRYDGQFFFGNNYWIGSQTLCFELQNNNTNLELPPFAAQYFLAKINLQINSKFTPATRQIHLGLCLPKSCNIGDVRNILSKEASRKTTLTITDVRTVPGSYLLTQDVKAQIIVIFGFVTSLLVLAASVAEVIIKKKYRLSKDADAEQNDDINKSSRSSKERILTKEEQQSSKQNIFLKLLLSFSAISNGNKVVSVKAISKDTIGCFHGLRVFSIAWIIMVHTYLQVFGVAKNKSLRTLTERNFMYQTIANATFSVDTFFFISGLLVTLGFFRSDTKEINNETKSLRSSLSKLSLMLAFRFIRLTPAYLFVLGVNEVVMRYIYSNSVFTPAIIDHITCDKYWWRNALYINNFYPQAEFCMLWSWYIANDTQFFVIAAVLLLIAKRGRKHLIFVAFAIAALLLSSWISTFVLAIKHNYVAKVQDPFALFDELYDKPWMRIGPYLVGMIIGYILFKVKGPIILTPLVVVLGWTLSLLCLGSLVYGLGTNGLVVPASAFYVALGHTAWGLSLAWITVACYSGYGGPFNALFSCKLFLPLSKLTYGAYLVHPVLMFLTSFALDGPLQIHNNLAIVIFFGNVVLSFICSFLISLGFEAPAINLMKLIFTGG